MQNNELGSAANGFFETLSDEKLVDMAVSHNTYALDEIISRYKNLVRAMARKYFLAGADNDDIIQEGMIGLFKAIRDFKGSHQSSFSSFASLCITRQVMTAIKTAARNKHMPLNTFISLSQPSDCDNCNLPVIEIISEKSADNPEMSLLIKEQIGAVNKKIKTELSQFEKNVLLMYLNGYSYNDISERLKTQVKSVDNALQRIKRKLGKVGNTY
ncbi:MAG: RNA polymerase sporulation sigma factor SigH [Firmicutes bacterium]|nr:RNA polymerase sporulation sigma factor SigH [Bacillota bacterium]